MPLRPTLYQQGREDRELRVKLLVWRASTEQRIISPMGSSRITRFAEAAPANQWSAWHCGRASRCLDRLSANVAFHCFFFRHGNTSKRYYKLTPPDNSVLTNVECKTLNPEISSKIFEILKKQFPCANPVSPEHWKLDVGRWTFTSVATGSAGVPPNTTKFS